MENCKQVMGTYKTTHKTLEFIEVKPQTRRYYFPDGMVEICGVISVHVSKSGTHRLNTKDGTKHIIPKGWLHLEFDASEWTF